MKDRHGKITRKATNYTLKLVYFNPDTQEVTSEHKEVFSTRPKESVIQDAYLEAYRAGKPVQHVLIEKEETHVYGQSAEFFFAHAELMN